MNTPPNQPSTPNQSGPHQPDADQLELLISKAVDGRATRLEWAVLEIAAHEKPVVWRDLALTMRDNALLEDAVNRAADRAEQVGLPASTQVSGRPSSLRTWGGWAAAAVLAVMFVAQWRNLANQPVSSTGSSQPQVAGLGSFTADEARKAYLQRGKQDGSVLGEMPAKVIVQGAPIKDGQGYEVVFIRQIVEKARVDDLVRFTSDEAGQQRIIRLRELYEDQLNAVQQQDALARPEVY